MKNFDQPFISDNSIVDLLNQKVELEQKIEKHLKKNGFPHFSSKKFVGDLGEYYAILNLSHLFEENTLIASKTSNAEYDIKGTLKIEVAKEWNLTQDVRLEVKTRYCQKGSPHLFGLSTQKFDILIYVSLNKDYSCHFIGLVRSSDIIPDIQKRISFNNYLDKIIYPTGIKFIPHI